MSKQLQPLSVAAPAFYGLNTQDSPVGMSANFAKQADNCVIDKQGRIAARQGHTQVSTSTGSLGSNPIEAIHEHVAYDGTKTVYSAGNNYVYTGYVENVGGMGVAFYPVPNKAYSLKFNVVDRSEEMTAATDNIVVPYLPVIQFATAMAAEERGETGGASAQALYALAKSSLADAISMDAARFPTETIWYDV